MLEQITIIDIILLVILGFFLIRAIMRGFISELMGLIGVVIAILASAYSYQTLAEFLRDISGIEDFWWEAASFIAVLVVTFAVLLELGRVLNRLIQSSPFSLINRLLGGALGLLKGVLLTYLLLWLLLLAMPMESLRNPHSKLPQAVASSLLVPHILTAGNLVMSFVPDVLTKAFNEKAQYLTSRALSAPELPAPAPAPSHGQ